MTGRYVSIRAHERRLGDGRVVPVRGRWVWYERKRKGGKRKAFMSTCPECGVSVHSVPMPNGGRVHFETGALSSVKHPCFHRGQGLPGGKDRETLDLFADHY